jgi:putative PIN family toxin of toxin-antitoxin system
VAGPSFRVVLDTNTLLRGLVSGDSAAAAVLRAAERRLFVPLLSKPVLDEYRAVLADAALVARFPEITARLVEVTLRRLRFVGDYVRTPGITFRYARDPGDQKFIELAIALGASHIVTADKDLLSLSTGRGDAARRFRARLPTVRVLPAEQFANELPAEGPG